MKAKRIIYNISWTHGWVERLSCRPYRIHQSTVLRRSEWEYHYSQGKISLILSPSVEIWFLQDRRNQSIHSC